MIFLFSILELIGIYMPLILGSYCSFFLLKIPFLTLETAFTFGSLLGSLVIKLNFSKYLIFLISFFISALGGAFVALLTYFTKKIINVSYFLAGIIVIGLFHGINQFIIDGVHLTLNDYDIYLSLFKSFDKFPQLTTIIFINIIIIFLFYILLKTSLGFSFKIYGNNNKFFDNYKINTDYIVIMGLIFSGAFAGISGLIFSLTNGFYDIGMGFGINLNCITILILGIAGMGSKVNIKVPIFGTFFYFLIQAFILKMKFDTKYFTMVQVLIIYTILFLVDKYSKGKKYEIGI